MLTQTAKYAIRALLYLTEQDSDAYCQAKEIAEATGIPANYLGKTMQKLAHARILDSQKGLHGGFCLARSASRISLFQILVAIETIPRDADVEAADDPVELPSNVYAKFAELSRMYNAFLKDTMLADLEEAKARRR